MTLSEERMGRQLREDMVWESALMEERGISREVEREVHGVVRSIGEYVKTVPVDYSGEGFFHRDERMETTVFGEDVKFEIKFYFFRDYRTYLRYQSHIRYIYQYIRQRNTVMMTVVVINRDIITNTFNGKIAHEIRHALQYVKINKGKINKPSCYRAVEVLRGKPLLSNFDKNGKQVAPIDYDVEVANIIYLSSKYEQEAYGQEMYNSIMYSSELPFLAYRHNNAYYAYQRLKESVKVVKEGGGNGLAAALERYGLSQERIVRKGENAVRKFFKRLIRAYSQADNDRIDYNEI